MYVGDGEQRGQEGREAGRTRLGRASHEQLRSLSSILKNVKQEE